MALNKDTLGQALYNVRLDFNNKSYEELMQQYGNMEAARLAMCKAEAEVIINHIKTEAIGVYQPGALVAGQVPVTATANVTAIRIQ